MTSTCQNCGAAKDPAFYAQNYCQLCTARIAEAIEHATKIGADTNAARREALSERAHQAWHTKPDPRGYTPRVSDEGFRARINIEPGSPLDPRLGGR